MYYVHAIINYCSYYRFFWLLRKGGTKNTLIIKLNNLPADKMLDESLNPLLQFENHFYLKGDVLLFAFEFNDKINI